MKCSTCKEELNYKEEEVEIEIPHCSKHKVKTSFSECPSCKSTYSTPEEMLNFAKRIEDIERKYKKA